MSDASPRRVGFGAVYGTRLAPLTDDELAALAPGAQVSAAPPAGPAGARFELSWPEGSAGLSWLGADDPGLGRQIEAASALVVRAAGGSLSPSAFRVLRQVTGTWQVVGVAADPALVEASPARLEALVGALADRLWGVVVREERLVDAAGRLLLGPDGARDPAAELPEPAEARQRARRAEEQLAANGVPVPLDVAPLPAAAQVLLRDPADVARRAQALWAVASRAAGVERYDAIDLLFRRGLWDAATPTEQDFLRAEHAPEPTLLAYRRRAEALWTLLWALGHAPELGAPDRPGGFERCTKILRQHPAERFVAEARLRPVEEVLDAAELYHRAQAVVAQAALRGAPPPPALNPAIVDQRHIALLWLIRHMKQPWQLLAADPGSGLPGAAAEPGVEEED